MYSYIILIIFRFFTIFVIKDLLVNELVVIPALSVKIKKLVNRIFIHFILQNLKSQIQ